MKWKWLNINVKKVLCLLSVAIASAFGADGVMAAEYSDSIALARYHQRMERRMEHWNRLIPNLFTIQYAGGTGMFSVGPGWDYGSHDQWETHILIGYLPKRYHGKSYWTATLKESFLPWTLFREHLVDVKPLVVSVGINSILHGDFWSSEPDRYPEGYYGFSSRVRFHLGIGQRITLNIPEHRRYLGRELSVYYEVSTCDLYVRQKILNGRIPFKDIITLGIGVIYTI